MLCVKSKGGGEHAGEDNIQFYHSFCRWTNSKSNSYVWDGELEKLDGEKKGQQSLQPSEA